MLYHVVARFKLFIHNGTQMSMGLVNYADPSAELLPVSVT